MVLVKKDFRKFYLICLYICFALAIWWPRASSAATARDLYYRAEACYQKLRNNAKKQKYRDQWLKCIDKFQKVYRHDPAGPWAPAGLYMSGKLYQKLFNFSSKDSDKKEARDIYERLIKRFPQSQYRQKAAKAIRSLTKEQHPKSDKTEARSSPPIQAKEPTQAKDKYLTAESCYRKLKKSSKKIEYRDQWLKCIDRFQEVYQHDPAGPWAAAGLYMSSKLYMELYNRSYKESDKQEALDLYGRVIAYFPRSLYRKKAAAAIDASRKTPHKAASEQVKPETVKEEPAADKIAEQIEKGALAQVPEVQKDKIFSNHNVLVEGLRFWSNPSYTRIVIDADSETDFAHRLLKQDPSIHKPQRLYVELNNSRLKEDLEKTIPINDNLLSDVRAGQHTADSVRVVVDIKSFETYKIFSLKNPFRIVIDVWGKQPKTDQANAPSTAKETKLPPSALAKQLALGVKRIVIDPGHGGRDYGAPGYLKGVHEKDIVLKIARRLAKKIRNELKCEVFLTRNRDRFLTLEERTAIANTKNADLFISIHTNSARDRRAYGIETYILNLATDEDSILVAARENATSTKNISDLQTILSDLMQNAKINESSRLAINVQESMYKNLRKNYSRIKDKGVKKAPFYVLLGAQMPSILIETAFVSNSRECKRLVNTKYQDRMSTAIVKGIRTYIKETSPTAFIESNPKKGSKG